MAGLAVSFAMAMATALLLTAAVRATARAWGVLDRPDGQRKLHKRSVPLWGGVAVYLAMVFGLFAACRLCDVERSGMVRLSCVLTCLAGLVCLVGAIDDCWRLRSRTKLVLQIASVAPLALFGGWVDRITVFGVPLELGWFGLPLTLFWLVGCINAINLLDGMDGLASIVGCSTAAMMGLIAASEGHPQVTVAATVLAGALAGFLCYNLPPASIFLGDSGSMVIGLTVGLLGIEGAMKTSATLSITTPAVIMALPMFDVLLAVVRRRLTGRRFDAADREHIHHRLLDRGLSTWQVLCIAAVFCLLTGAAATAASLLRSDMLAWVITITLVVAVIRLRLFGHHELSLVKKTIARNLANLANRLFRLPADEPPTAADLAKLSLEDAWLLLVDEIALWRVCRLELSITSGRRLNQQWTWMHPQANHHEFHAWNVTLGFRAPGAGACQLRAALAESDALSPLYLGGVTRLLKAFGRRFAAGASAPTLALVGPPDDERWPQTPEEAA